MNGMQAVRANGCRTSLSAAYRRRWRPADVQQFHSSTARTTDTTSEGSQKPQVIDIDAYSSVTINPESKTVETAVGELPISPLMDPSFHEARGKYTKPKALPSQFKQQKWQRQLARNPYAKALATPVRRCIISNTTLPSYFLQRFTLVSHPETGKPWFTPHGLGSKALATQSEPDLAVDDEAPETAAEAEPNPAHDAETAPTSSTSSETASQQQQQQQQQQHPHPTEEDHPSPSGPPGPKFPPPTPRTGPSAYVLARQRLLRELQLPNSRYHQQQRKLLRPNDHGQGRLTAALDAANWRADMDGVLLELLRRRVVEGLVHFARLVEGEEGRKYIVRCEGWEGVKGLRYRGCVLFLGPVEGEEGEGGFVPPRLSTMDAGAVKFGRTVPVHNLGAILGEEHVARLRRESVLFRDGRLFMLARQATVNLQMLLWKLQGYMAWEELPEPGPPGQKSKAKPRTSGQEEETSV